MARRVDSELLLVGSLPADSTESALRSAAGFFGDLVFALPDGETGPRAAWVGYERERRARIISADGEYQAAKKLAQAAAVMSADPAALQLRLLQTVVEVAAEKNSTLVMPVPVELLRFFDRASRVPGEIGDGQDGSR